MSQMAVARGFHARAVARQHCTCSEHHKKRCALDPGGLFHRPWVKQFMKPSTIFVACFCVASFLGAVQRLAAQDPPPSAPKPQAAPARSDIQARITIEVTGGEKDTPVENASVYVKFVEEHVIKRDKKLELNVKTSREGIAHVPNAPMGRALVQVIAEGWKTYGRWLDITDPKQTIKVHLERPPKWY